jgi:CheY-like chemotaxis protein
VQPLHFVTVPVAEVLGRGLRAHTTPPPVSVLIVDDEAAIAETLARVLQRAGYATTAAYCAESALEFAELVPPQVLITDFSMPGMNGLELAVRLSQSIPDCDIFLFSAAEPGEMVEHIARSGHAFRFLAKPLHPEDLLCELSRCRAKNKSNSWAEVR